MPTYLFSYRTSPTPTPQTPEAMSAWQAWFEGIGEHVVEIGNPIFARSTVGDTGADTALGGYSLISADDLQSAVALADGCPVLSGGGGVEVGEITPLGGDSVTTTADDHARVTGLAG